MKSALVRATPPRRPVRARERTGRVMLTRGRDRRRGADVDAVGEVRCNAVVDASIVPK